MVDVCSCFSGDFLCDYNAADMGQFSFNEARKFLIRYLVRVVFNTTYQGNTDFYLTERDSIYTSCFGTKRSELPVCFVDCLQWKLCIVQDIDTSLVKLLAEDHSPSLVPYIENHELHLAFEDTQNALEKNSVRR